VATASGAGVVTAVSEGTAQISATRKGRIKHATMRVQRPPVANLVTPGDESAVIAATAEGRTASVRVRVPEIESIDLQPKGVSLPISAELQAEAAIHTEGVEGRVLIQAEGARRNFPVTQANGQPLTLTLGETTWKDAAGTVHAAELVLRRRSRDPCTGLDHDPLTPVRPLRSRTKSSGQGGRPTPPCPDASDVTGQTWACSLV